MEATVRTYVDSIDSAVLQLTVSVFAVGVCKTVFSLTLL